MPKPNESKQCLVLIVAGDDAEVVGRYPSENIATVRKLLLDAIGTAADKPRSTGLVLADPKEVAVTRARLKSMRRTPRRDP